MPRNVDHQAKNGIGTLNENPLHAALKDWLARPGDQQEVAVDGYVIDLVRDDRLIEVQTRNFTAIRAKLTALLEGHEVRLVHPIAEIKWIVRQDEDGCKIGRRKSPKRGRVEMIFDELVRMPRLPIHPRFSLEVLLIHEEEMRHFVGKRAWRKRGWATCDRKLLDVVSRRTFETPADFASLIPETASDLFGTQDLVEALGITRSLAQKMAYCLRKMDMLDEVGKRGNAKLYARR